jgi:ABC-type spermidine/putrescine transport system permease subunit II
MGVSPQINALATLIVLFIAVVVTIATLALTIKGRAGTPRM